MKYIESFREGERVSGIYLCTMGLIMAITLR